MKVHLNKIERFYTLETKVDASVDKSFFGFLHKSF